MPVHIRLDPLIWNTARDSFLGRAVGQTFFASDTIISRITVWRPPGMTSVWGAHIFLTGTSADGRPDVNQVFLDGQTLAVFDSDPPGQMIEMPFTFDPPVTLPRPGTYAFFLQGANCTPGSVWYIAASNLNPYHDGSYWLTGRVDSSPCHLRAVDGGSDVVDLLFDIEFCSSGATATSVRSWGELKVIYR